VHFKICKRIEQHADFHIDKFKTSTTMPSTLRIRTCAQSRCISVADWLSCE